jgi:hypothetical protein
MKKTQEDSIAEVTMIVSHQNITLWAGLIRITAFDRERLYHRAEDNFDV